MMPNVSVVVPIYNVEKYLDRCLSSIVSQTYENLEIILVDDGSPDRCPMMCDEWAKKDARIKVVHKQNAGAGMARNTGIECATGDYIFFFDSDDYVLHDTVEKCVEQVRGREADTVLFDRKDVLPDGSIVEKEMRRCEVRVYQDEEIVKELLPGLLTYRSGYGVSAWSKMFSLRVIREHNLRFRSEREILSEDACFCLDYFSKARKVAAIPDRLYCYFQNQNSFSRAYSADRQVKNNAFLQSGTEQIHSLRLPKVVESGLQSRYHVYSLAAMKQIMASDLTASEKRQALREIYRDPIFRKTVKPTVLALDSRTIAAFAVLIKLRLYPICDWLLKIKK